MLPANIENFVKSLSRLPGIGRKTAERLGFYILSRPKEFAAGLSESIIDLRMNIKTCSVCGNITDSDPCSLCGDSFRDKGIICVVETAMDIYTIEDTHCFKGLYHVLGGLISPLDGVTPEDLTFNELSKRVRENEVKELIIATSPTTEGDTTALYLKELFAPLGVKISNLARGIPIGTDLQYAGVQSLSQAIKHREEL